MGGTTSNGTADTSSNSNTSTDTTSLSNSPPPPSAFQQHRSRSNSNNSRNSNGGPNDGSRGNDTSSSRPSWRIVILFLIFNFAYIVLGLVFMTPLFPSIQDKELVDNAHIFTNYSLSFTLSDLYILSSLSTIASLIAIYKSYHCDTLHLKAITRFTHIERFHPNNTIKTREEMEEEELEEQCFPNKFMRYICRYSFCSEAFVFLEGILLIIKCLARLNTEIGHFDGDQPYHPIFWIALCVSALYCSFIAFGLEKICIRTSAVGNYKRQHVRRERAVNRTRRRMLLRREERNSDNDDQLESLLEEPLLSSSSTTPNRSNGNLTEQNGDDQNASNNQDDNNNDELVATSDITADAHYKAGWKDLWSICYPDKYYFAAAFIFLIFAAIAQVLIPRYTGNMLDAIATYASDGDDNADDDGNGYIWKVPGFLQNMNKLIIASILGGVFSGARGSIFTIVGARVNVRLRTVLMDSLLAQDIGFFDITKTGDITSRLSSDTTLVGDQVTLNVNVFLRSLVQAIGVLIFMAILSWQLTLVAFISVPAITLLSRWYGDYIRSLTKLMQKKLADGNSISEAALGSMPTVRALGGESTAMKEFEEYMDQYKGLNMRYAVAYLGYATAVTSLPQLVTAVVLFYGGLLVMAEGHDHMTSGQLVSFLLYLSSLSDAFNSIGYIFASLTQAVGAADKVFELINRKPARKSPTTSDDEARTSNSSGRSQRRLPDPGHHIEQFRKVGVRPTECSGEVTLNKLTMYYPGRPQRRILDDMNLYVPSGAVAALVGPSGGGKSSIISLIQNLYEPRSGDIFIDGIKIRDLSPDWLSKNVAVVSQEPTLFARSIKRNIIYGLEGTYDEPSMEEIEEAARLANAHTFIENLPMKYETDVGERGVQLSGGQKQRIAIARALVRRPKILLLDEATSALDAESEAMVQEAIDKMISNDRSRGGGDGEDAPSMTVIIVAHRLSTIQNADIIFVIESGKVVESGSHNELTRNTDGAYSNLISRQIKDRDDKEGSAEESSLMESMMVDDSIATTDDSVSDVVDDKSTSSLPLEDKE